MTFPCKECLVKVCCSEYCDRLEENSRIIDMYLVSLNKCPDCGNTKTLSGQYLKSRIKVCFNCLKVFDRQSIAKLDSIDNKLIRKNKYYHVSQFPSSKIYVSKMIYIILPQEEQEGYTGNIITSISDFDDSIDRPPTKEKYDILYVRLDKYEADYIIKTIKEEIEKSITEIPKPKPSSIKHPSWFNKYPSINEDEPQSCLEWQDIITSI